VLLLPLRMHRLLLLTLALSAMFACATSSEDRNWEGQQLQSTFVGPEEIRDIRNQAEEFRHQRRRGHKHHGDSLDEVEVVFLPGPPSPTLPSPMIQSPILPMVPPHMIQNPAPMDPMLLPVPQPFDLPVEAMEGDNGVMVDPVPMIQPVIVEIPSSTLPPPPSSTPEGLVPEAILTCETTICHGGSVCLMEHNHIVGREEPTCVFTGSVSSSSCDDFRCSTGFRCQMKESSSCSRLPCPLNPICIPE
ncbi:hypothetical protein PMAYCL1PPCAC_12896, partial [Pristionchus mayeri]